MIRGRSRQLVRFGGLTGRRVSSFSFATAGRARIRRRRLCSETAHRTYLSRGPGRRTCIARLRKLYRSKPAHLSELCKPAWRVEQTGLGGFPALIEGWTGFGAEEMRGLARGDRGATNPSPAARGPRFLETLPTSQRPVASEAGAAIWGSCRPLPYPFEREERRCGSLSRSL